MFIWNFSSKLRSTYDFTSFSSDEAKKGIMVNVAKTDSLFLQKKNRFLFIWWIWNRHLCWSNRNSGLFSLSFEKSNILNRQAWNLFNFLWHQNGKFKLNYQFLYHIMTSISVRRSKQNSVFSRRKFEWQCLRQTAHPQTAVNFNVNTMEIIRLYWHQFVL